MAKLLSSFPRISCIAVLIIGGKVEERVILFPSFARIGIASWESSITYDESAASRAEGRRRNVLDALATMVLFL